MVLGGPNGAGKTTVAPRLLRGTLRVDEFVNADTLAAGLSAFAPEGAAFEAGRIMLARLDVLARHRVSFAFESTLASRSHAVRLAALRRRGYSTHVVYLWLPSVELAVARVQARVKVGGHDVPEEAIRRRYERGRQNFFDLYQPDATTWRCYDSSLVDGPRLIAAGGQELATRVYDVEVWRNVKEGRESD